MITSLNLYKDSIFNSTNKHVVAIDTTLYRAPNLKYDRLIQGQIIISDLDGTTYKIFDEYIDVKSEILQANSNYLLATYARLEYDYEDGEMPFVKYYRINRIEDRPNIIRLYWELDTFMTYWQYLDFFAPNWYAFNIKRTNKKIPNILYYGDNIGFNPTLQSKTEDLISFIPDTNYIGINIIFGLKYNVYNSNNKEISKVDFLCFKIPQPGPGISRYETLVKSYNKIITLFEFNYNNGGFKACQLLNCYVIPDNLVTQSAELAGIAHIINNEKVEELNLYKAVNLNTTPLLFNIKNQYYKSYLQVGNVLYELPYLLPNYTLELIPIMSNYNLQIIIRIPGFNDIDITKNFEVPIMNSSSETTEENSNRILKEALQGIAAVVGVIASVATGGGAFPLAAVGAGLTFGNIAATENQTSLNHQLSSGQCFVEIGFNTWLFLQQNNSGNSYIKILTYHNSADNTESGLLQNAKSYYQEQGAYCQFGLSTINDLKNFPLYLINNSDPDFDIIGLPSHTYVECDCLPRGLPKEICDEIRTICNEGIYIKWL